ncbi:hypothetical protein [Pararhizobium sp. A13]|uniref:hypothetical protein n=1 Tax=Pararhizobium sp. A13 TaxID=3133975 RepID=UPI00324A1D8D
MTFGVCKLTGAKGTFIKCHLLPKAITAPPDRSEVRVEGGEGRLPTARFDSWFDKTIVTRKGEDIFERLDAFAISELRRHKLVWSSWADYEVLCPIESERIDDQWGVRHVAFSNPERMRLFCLSLLWRAAMTELPGFTTVMLPLRRLQLLTDMLLSDSATPFEHFPIHLIQLRTRGGWHNQTPIKQVKRFPDVDGTEREVGTFRFYMDGLIIHIDDDVDDPVHWRFKGVALGESPEQVILTMPFERSRQDELITSHMLNELNDERHAAIVDRIFAQSSET